MRGRQDEMAVIVDAEAMRRRNDETANPVLMGDGLDDKAAAVPNSHNGGFSPLRRFCHHQNLLRIAFEYPALLCGVQFHRKNGRLNWRASAQSPGLSVFDPTRKGKLECGAK
jgi:hypothetical protein